MIDIKNLSLLKKIKFNKSIKEWNTVVSYLGLRSMMVLPNAYAYAYYAHDGFKISLNVNGKQKPYMVFQHFFFKGNKWENEIIRQFASQITKNKNLIDLRFSSKNGILKIEPTAKE